MSGMSSGVDRLSIATLLFAVLMSAGCQTAKPPVERTPIFVGSPGLSEVRPGTLALASLGAPPPTAKQLRFSVRTAKTNRKVGISTETLKATKDGNAQFLEETAYSVSKGRCSLLIRNEAVAVGGFLTLLEAGQMWSPDCAGLTGGKSRREMTGGTVAGQLFPLKVGNKLAIRYKIQGSESETDTGFAEYEESIDEAYEVIERAVDFKTANGQSVGEVFRIRTAVKTSRGKPRIYEFLFSTALGWRVGYRTDLEATLIEFSR
ncbi:MAG: hypothetical protein ABI612_16200 [Betaproteobacteria bacterium]